MLPYKEWIIQFSFRNFQGQVGICCQIYCLYINRCESHSDSRQVRQGFFICLYIYLIRRPDKQKIQFGLTYPIIYKPVTPEKFTLENTETLHNFI